MITCFLKYEIDPRKLAEFEHYGRLWITLVNRLGGTHHGYLMPSEGANDVAYASFSFPSFAAYETYRANSFKDAECQAAFAYGAETQCIRRHERSFLRPVFEGL
jgi:NIPSNAP